MEYKKKERIFENAYSRKCKDKENSFNDGSDEHIHDYKALPKLIECIKSDNITSIAIGKLIADGDYDSNIFLDS
jgi:hypothetical protein